MTPGERADKVVTLLYGSASALDYMVMRKKLQRTKILEILTKIELAREHLRNIAGENR